MADTLKREEANAGGRKSSPARKTSANRAGSKRGTVSKAISRNSRTNAGTERTCILVLGMHRAGTSVLTRVLSLMGATLPKRLMGAGEGNEAGHWEPERLVAYHDQMLSEFGSAWHDWRPLDLKSVPVSRREAMKADIREILDEDYGASPLIVVKEPRICRFASFFCQAVTEAGYEVRPVLTFRNPLEVINSLLVRKSVWPKTHDALDAALLWLAYNLEAEKASRAFPRAVVSYDGLMRDWEKPLSVIADALGNPFPQNPGDIGTEVSGFIDEGHRHQVKSQEDVLLDPRTAGWISDCYAALNTLETGRNTAQAMDTLDRIHAEFMNALPLLRQAVESRREETEKKRQLDESLARVSAEAEEKKAIYAEHAAVLEQERDASRRQAETLSAEVASAKEQIANLESTAQAAKEQLREAEKGAERGRDMAQAAEARFSQAQAEIDDLRREIAAKEKQLADERRTAAELHARLAAAVEAERAEKQAQSQQTASLEALLADERAQNEVEIGALKKVAAEKEARIADLEAGAQEREARIGTLEADGRERQARLAELERDAGEKTARITGLEQDVELRMREAQAAHARLQQVKEEFRNSTSWKLTAPFRAVKAGPRTLARIARATPAAVRVGGGVLPTVVKAVQVLRREGLVGVEKKLSIAGIPFAKPNVAEVESGSPTTFIEQQVKKRRSILFSDWHVSFTKSRLLNSPFDYVPITISVVLFNSERWLEKFWKSLLEQKYPLELLTLHFVDHQSSDGTMEMIGSFKSSNEKLFNSIEITSRGNDGYGSGNDHAIRQSRDEFVLVTNVDIEFFPDSLTEIVKHAVLDEKDVASWELRQCPFEHPKYYDPVTMETCWSSHACILIRRSAYLQVGGYERRIFMYGEDVELSFRFLAYGHSLRYVPSAKIRHFVELDNPTVRPNQLSGSIAANILLRYRYGNGLQVKDGEDLLGQLNGEEGDQHRQESIVRANQMIEENKPFFIDNRPPKTDLEFPFNGFDYGLRRDGHDVSFDPSEWNGELPLVTIVTRTHGPKVGYLTEAITSVLNQTYPNIEHIIVEDRTDYAKEIVDRVRSVYGNNIRYLKSDGEGRSRAGNVGLAAASGEYMMFLDNDDLLFADHVEILIHNILEEPKKISSYALGWNVSTQEIGGGYREKLHSIPDTHKLSYDPDRLKTMNFIPIQCIIFSKKIYDLCGGFREDLDYLEDWNLWVRYSRYGPFYFVPKVTSTYRTPADEKDKRNRQIMLDSAYQKVRNL